MTWGLCRNYIQDRIADTSFDYTEFKEAFSIESNAGSILDRSYHIGAPQLTLSPVNDVLYDDIVNIDITFAYRGYNCPQDKIYEVIDEVECIRRHLLDKKNIATAGFNDVFGSTVVTEQLTGDNDNAFTITVGLSFRLFIRSGDNP